MQAIAGRRLSDLVNQRHHGAHEKPMENRCPLEIPQSAECNDQAGRPEGKDDEFWHKAKAVEDSPDAANPPLPNDDPS
jgi:hypothetical protein